MQKYGVANSSCSRITCAPRACAARTRRSARSRLSGRSQLHANCVAATVTVRGADSGMQRLPRRGAHALADCNRRTQRSLSVLAADDHRPLTADRRQERLNFRQQRIALRERLLLDVHRQLTGPGGHRALADHGQDLLMQIDRQVGVVAEHAQLTLGLEAHATRRDVGDAAVFERSRALAISISEENTGVPTASSEATGLPTIICTRSISWIIRSSTTLTSVPR